MSKESKPVISLHEKIIQKYIKEKRPPEEIRDQLDISYSFDNQVLMIYEIRPDWRNKNEKIEIPVAKSRFIKSRGLWKLYWQRANGKWLLLEEPNGELNDISEVLRVIEEDTYGCFWG